MKEISINEIGPLRIAQVENKEAGTGCTVFINDEGMHAGLDVRGSAFGLSAASGVMQYLSEQDIGFDTGVKKVPLIVQSNLFDLTVGDSDVYPDEAMGYEAAESAYGFPSAKELPDVMG